MRRLRSTPTLTLVLVLAVAAGAMSDCGPGATDTPTPVATPSQSASIPDTPTPVPTPNQPTRPPDTPTLVPTSRPTSTPTRSAPTPSPTSQLIGTPNPAKLGTVERDVPYGTADGVSLKMDIYYPKTVNGPAPAIVFVHGGSYTGGTKSVASKLSQVKEFVARGYLVAAVDYRLAPTYKFPAQIEDVKCAVRYLRARAATYYINPNRIGAWGESAGGHLVALLGTADASAGFEGLGGYPDQSSRVQAVIDMYGPTDLPHMTTGTGNLSWLLGVVTDTTQALEHASPVTYVSPDDPPFLILHGDQDRIVPPSQSQALYDRLKAAGVPATLVIVKNAGHGWSNNQSPTPNELLKMMVDFFNRYLR